MTHYDLLIDSVIEELYLFWEDGSKGFDWDESLARERSNDILKMVEEFQNMRSELNNKRWRASD